MHLFSLYCRTLQHQASIRNREETNAFAKHLMIHHPEEEGNQNAFKFSLVEVHGRPQPRLVSESCHIHSSEAIIPMNSKAEWHQPMVARVVVSRELDELEQRSSSAAGRIRRGGAS